MIKENAKLLRAMGNEKRLEILFLLKNKEMSVGSLQRQINLSQSALSQHLAVLRNSGLLKTRRQAQTIYYKLSNKKAAEIIKILKEK